MIGAAEGTLLLTRGDVRRLLPLRDCIDAVAAALGRHAAGEIPPPGVMGVHVPGGGFHTKTAVLPPYFASKLNANFPGNPTGAHLPTIQGVVLLFDATNGRPLAVMDSMEITSLRTGAATAIAVRHLARSDTAVVTVCGCGTQGRIQLQSVLHERSITRVFAHDIDRATAARFARESAAALGIAVEVAEDLSRAVGQSDIVLTCTTAHAPVLACEDVRPGTFVAAVGADSEDKQELEPMLLSRATVVVDNLEQCATIGELHHALAAGVLTRSAVHAELGQVVAGRRPGRTTAAEIAIFDSTGTALQDVAAGALVYERALAAGAGRVIDLAS
jgi:ornithine cyclodeaminase/alanine dehydrogenase-like protein (mu-crystallin family)